MVGVIAEILITMIGFYGGLVALGFLTSWKVAVVVFLILFGYGMHMDWLFLRRKDLRKELNIMALQDLQELVVMHQEVPEQMQAADEELGNEDQSLH
jgi:hypothetical protein